MKFIVDAQLPRRLARQLEAASHDALHSLDLPMANRASDDDITALASGESRVVVTKDTDFVNSFLLRRLPPKLLLISAGNISNDALARLFERNLPAIESALRDHDFVELSLSALTIHF
jgi:predicted nuclease of predicted toxin-antitoxin system